MKHHLKHMAIAGALIVVVLLVAGVDLGRAVPYALALACPVGMILMMVMMNKHSGQGGGQGHCHGGDGDLDSSSAGDRQVHDSHPTPEMTRDNHERLP